MGSPVPSRGSSRAPDVDSRGSSDSCVPAEATGLLYLLLQAVPHPPASCGCCDHIFRAGLVPAGEEASIRPGLAGPSPSLNAPIPAAEGGLWARVRSQKPWRNEEAAGGDT